MIQMLRDISRHQIIFGGTIMICRHFCAGWLDKKNGSNDFADCELAWTKYAKGRSSD